MTNVKFITFGDGSYGFRAAGKRISTQAHKSGLFPLGVENYTLERLYREDPGFEKSNRNFIEHNPKGLGNYIWKPQMLFQALQDSKNGDVLCLIDAGCQINLTVESRLRFQFYLDTVKANGALFMQIKAGSFGNEKFLDCEWTKKSLLNRLDPDMMYRFTPQIQSGIILMTCNETTREFAREWLALSQSNDYELLTSPNNFKAEDPWFRGHRWEQSILSLLVKRSEFTYVPDETFWHPDWRKGLDYPIWAMRNRSGGDAFRRNFIDLFQIGLARTLS